MMSRNLARLLNPKSIALFGGAWAENVIQQLQKSSYEGEIWPVHPTREVICGLNCFESIDDLPAAPDASFIGVNRELSIEIVRQLSAMSAGGVTCFASGFSESEKEGSGGADLQSRLLEAAGDMPLLGPNCYGFLNYLDGVTLWPDQHGGRSVEQGIAIIGQSSNVLINMTMQKRGLPVSYVVTAGNQAQTGLSDIANHLLEDPRVTAIGLYIEGFGDIRKLESMAAKARNLGKPIVAIKVGKSEKSRLATLTHTASLTGNSAASSALMKRLGIVEVNSIAVFLETLKLLHVCGPLAGSAVSSMSCSGGEAGLIADMAAESRIDFRGFSEKQYRALKQVLGPLVTVTNPLDYHTFIWHDEEKLYECYKAVLEDGFDLNILIMDIPHNTRCDAMAWQGPLNAIKQAEQVSGANVALLATLPENLIEDLSDELLSSGIVPLHGMEEMIAAVDATIRAGEMLQSEVPEPVFLSADLSNSSSSGVFISSSSGLTRGSSTQTSELSTLDPRVKPEDDYVERNDALMHHSLDEAQSKFELAAHGLRFPKSVAADTPALIAEAAKTLTFPVVLKGLGIAHKSEAGAVVLNLQSPEAVKAAAENMDGISGFLAEEMVTEPIAELLIGITRDETGIFLLTLGAGGTLTEILDDKTCLLIPASRAEISASFEELRIDKLLKGYRGKPAADMNAILDAIEAVQAYCMANPNLIELDINPLIAREADAIAVDALIVKEPTG